MIAKSTGCRRSRARPATGSISTATAGDQSCRLEAYVIRNDEVIVSRTFGKFACSWFQPRNGTETVGWIETDGDCVAGSIRPPAELDWLGEWRAYDDFIRISKSKEAGVLAITSEGRLSDLRPAGRLRCL